MVGVAAQRRLQRYPRQRAVAARVGRKGQQHKRFDAPRVRQRARQQRPQRLGRPGTRPDRQRVQGVADRDVGERARQRRRPRRRRASLPRTPCPPQRSPSPPRGAHSRRDPPATRPPAPRPARGWTPPANRCAPGRSPRSTACRSLARAVEPPAVENRGGGHRRGVRVVDGPGGSAAVDAVPAAAGLDAVDDVRGVQVDAVLAEGSGQRVAQLAGSRRCTSGTAAPSASTITATTVSAPEEPATSARWSDLVRPGRPTGRHA